MRIPSSVNKPWSWHDQNSCRCIISVTQSADDRIRILFLVNREMKDDHDISKMACFFYMQLLTTTGKWCFWLIPHRCLSMPDRQMSYQTVPDAARRCYVDASASEQIIPTCHIKYDCVICSARPPPPVAKSADSFCYFIIHIVLLADVFHRETVRKLL